MKGKHMDIQLVVVCVENLVKKMIQCHNNEADYKDVCKARSILVDRITELGE